MYAKKQEDKGASPSPFTPIQSNDGQEVAEGQTEKTTRDVNVAEQSHAEGQKDTASEQGKVDIEASVQAHDLKEETAREFHTSINMDQKVSNVYEQGKTAIRSMTEDELVSEGHRETEKYVKPVTIMVAMFASSSAVSNIKSELRKSAKAVQETANLVEQGKISLSDLSGKQKDFKEKLEKMELWRTKRMKTRKIYYRFASMMLAILCAFVSIPTGGLSGAFTVYAEETEEPTKEVDDVYEPTREGYTFIG